MQGLVNGSTDSSIIAERFVLTAACAQLVDRSNHPVIAEPSMGRERGRLIA